MAASLEALGLDRLSREEQLEVVGQLWDRILQSEAPGSLLSDAQRAELRRRVADAELHPENYVDWEVALECTLKRLGQ